METNPFLTSDLSHYGRYELKRAVLLYQRYCDLLRRNPSGIADQVLQDLECAIQVIEKELQALNPTDVVYSEEVNPLEEEIIEPTSVD